MRYTYILILVVLTSLTKGFSQNKESLTLGGGYFGHTITHPGMVLETEYSFGFTSKASLPLRLDIGFYDHPRYHRGFFLDLSIGMRRQYRSGLFLEESIGIGVLEPYINSDAVYEVMGDGTVKEGSRLAPLDLMPSMTLGIGYDLSKDKDQKTFVWLRPKLFWQYPHKNSSTFHVALQAGISYSIKQRAVHRGNSF